MHWWLDELRTKDPGKRVRFTQAQRNLLASKAMEIRFSRLKELANAVTPETLLRWNRSIREECLNHLVLFSEASLRLAIGEYIEHFHQERPHQGLGNEIIEPQFRPTDERGESVECRKRLGGLLKYYAPIERKAA